jgi:hypothetical protein
MLENKTSSGYLFAPSHLKFAILKWREKQEMRLFPCHGVPDPVFYTGVIKE